MEFIPQTSARLSSDWILIGPCLQDDWTSQCKFSRPRCAAYIFVPIQAGFNSWNTGCTAFDVDCGGVGERSEREKRSISFGVFLLTESLCYNKECYVYTYPLSIYNKSIFRNVSSRITHFGNSKTEFSVLSFLGRSGAPTFGRVSFARKFRMPDDQRHAVDTREYGKRERKRERERGERKE